MPNEAFSMLGFTDVPSQVTINGQIKKKYIQKIIFILLLVNRKTKTDIIQYTLFVHYKKKKREKKNPMHAFLMGTSLTD